MEAWQLVVLLGAVILAIAFLRPEQPVNGASENIAKEMQEAIEYFSADFDEQNGRLLESVSEMKQQAESKHSKLLGRIESLEQQLFFLQQQMSASQVTSTVLSELNTLAATQEQASQQEAPESKEAEPISNRQSTNIKERYSQIFELYQAGKSIEYVAKKLGMNKGEVQLIIQLASQEEQFRV